jgi:hypothetical protein
LRVLLFFENPLLDPLNPPEVAPVAVKTENSPGGTVSIYTPMIEESLRTTVCSRSKLDWLIENAPLEYAKLVLDGTMQEYFDMIDGTGQDQLTSCTERLAERFPHSIAEDIAREMMMYS